MEDLVKNQERRELRRRKVSCSAGTKVPCFSGAVVGFAAPEQLQPLPQPPFAFIQVRQIRRPT